MRWNFLTGTVAVCASLAFGPVAHADWRDSILGNQTYSGNLGGGSPAMTPRSAQKAQKPTGTRTASLGNTDYTPSKSQASKRKSSGDSERSSSTPRRKTATSSSSGSGAYKYPSKNQSITVGQTLAGQASYYWQPQQLASGGYFNPSAMTAAHKTLPFGTKVRVTNQRNNQSVVVTINDRGPYIAGRIIDLSSGAAGVIGMKQAGVVPVRVAVLGK